MNQKLGSFRLTRLSARFMVDLAAGGCCSVSWISIRISQKVSAAVMRCYKLGYRLAQVVRWGTSALG